MSMKQVVFLTILMLSACSPQKNEPQSKIIKTSVTSQQVTIAPDKTEAKFLISADGIGKAKLGMTLGELKKISDRDTKFELISPFTIDSSAIAVSQGGLLQYYILYQAGTTSHPDEFTPTNEDPITLLVTDNYNYHTPEGIKVGTSIQEAENIYGDAILAYNQEGESEEYITFKNNDASNIRFRASSFKLISDGSGYSGIYAEYPGVPYTTDKYQEDAAIAVIEVSCTQENCPN